MAKKIVLVDDSPTLRASARFYLSDAGFEINEAEDGLKGLELLRKMEEQQHFPSLIITDINMPHMNGIHFITEVKKTKLRYIPILVLTTEGHEKTKQEGRKAGAAGWLMKPFKPEQLIRIVKKFTGN